MSTTAHTGFEHWEGDGDWSEDPWFLRDGLRYLDEAGFPIEKRRLAAEGLKRVYTPTVCLEIRSDPHLRFGPIIALFIPQPPGIICPLLDFGLNLQSVGTIEDTDLLGHLRARQDFRAAAYEVRVHAALVNSGYQTRRVPRATGRRPDLAVAVEGAEWEVELKVASDANLDVLDSDLFQQLSTGSSLAIPGLHLWLVGSLALAKRALDPGSLADLSDELPGIATAFKEAADRIRLDGGRSGRHAVPPYGEIVAEPRDGFGSWTSQVIPDLAPGKKAARCLRLIASAMQQLTGKHPGAIVLGVHRAASLPLIEKALGAWNHAHPGSVGDRRLIVLVDHISHETEGTLQVVLPIALPLGRLLSPSESQFARAAGGCSGRLAIRAHSADEDEPSVRLDTARRRQTSVSIGTVSMPPNGGCVVRFRFDGSSPEVIPGNQPGTNL